MSARLTPDLDPCAEFGRRIDYHPADRAVFWGTTLLCALAALILPLAG